MLPRNSRVRLTRQLEKDLNVPDEATENVQMMAMKMTLQKIMMGFLMSEIYLLK